MSGSRVEFRSIQEEERAELEEVLHSQTFAKSPVLARLLRYLCDKYFGGDSDNVKEYSIALDVLGRQPDFGDKRDSLVRVGVHRLRKKLKFYYDTEGAGHDIQITLNPGVYVPHFERKSQTAVEGEITEDPSEYVAPESRLSEAVAAPVVVVERPRARWRVPLLVLAILALAAGVFVFMERRNRVTASVQQPELVAAPPPPGEAIRIRAGYPYPQYVDRLGNVWSGDRFFEGGVANQLRFGSRQLRLETAAIARDPSGDLFRTFRAGTFTYKIPLKAGTYELRLHFAEPQFGPETGAEGSENMRVFDVDANGKPLLRFFDIFSDSGGHNVADVRVFRPFEPGKDGLLTLEFKAVKDTPLVNAIEIIPLREALAPVRIVMGSESATDSKGQVWGADRFFRNGRTVPIREHVSATADPALFGQERYGHFDYSIPLANGKYTVRLFFAETHFGPTSLGGGGTGSRVFDVTANNRPLLRNFDIFKEAGANHALVKTFHGLQPNGQGKLILSFDPVVNYAAVKAIEISPDSVLSNLPGTASAR